MMGSWPYLVTPDHTNNSEIRISQHLVKLKRKASSRIKEKHTKRRKKAKIKQTKTTET